MARTLTGAIRHGFGLNYAGDIDYGENKLTLPFPADLIIGSGNGAGQCNLAWLDHRSIAASTTEDLDLSGSLPDGLGGSAAFTKVKGIYIRAAAANGGNLIVGGDASAAFVGPFADSSDKIVLPAGGVFMVADLATGWTVTNSTADVLQVENDDSGDAAEYDIAIIGLS